MRCKAAPTGLRRVRDGRSGADSYVDETFEVRKLNEDVAVIRMLGETYCACTAHPSHGSYDHFISLKHKVEVKLFEGLSDAGKRRSTNA